MADKRERDQSSQDPKQARGDAHDPAASAPESQPMTGADDAYIGPAFEAVDEEPESYPELETDLVMEEELPEEETYPTADEEALLLQEEFEAMEEEPDTRESNAAPDDAPFPAPEEEDEDEDLAYYEPQAELGEPVHTFSSTGVPDPNRKLGRSAPIWFLLAFVATILVLSALFIFNPDRSDELPLQVTAGVPGGVAVPITTTTTVDSVTEAFASPTPLPPLEPGMQVQVANTDGQGIRLRADASTDSLTMEIFNEGDLFQVVEPSSDYIAYPVEAEGYQWIRIQSEDGLTGWTVREFLAPAE